MGYEEVYKIPNFKPRGAWQIGGEFGLTFAVSKKPSLIARILCTYLLDWKWIASPTEDVGSQIL